jgi:DNA repair protein RadC
LLAFDPLADDRERYARVMDRAARAGPIADSRVFAWVMDPMSRPQRYEIAWLASIDEWGHMTRLEELARGELDSVAVCTSSSCANVAAAAVAGRERWCILAHNHPRGFAHPSDADRVLTHSVGEALERRGVRLLDHVILGHDEHYSFTEKRLWQSR